MPDLQSVYLIFHLIGIAIGAGGAFTGDALFFHFLKTRDFSENNKRILGVASRMVWIGLAILFISGSLLFMLAPDYYMNSPKFLAKMTIVLVITLNGLLFHSVHMTRLSELRMSLFVSGAISVVSWLSVIVFGSLRSLPMSYAFIMGSYLNAVLLAVTGSLLLRNKIIKTIHLE